MFCPSYFYYLLIQFFLFRPQVVLPQHSLLTLVKGRVLLQQWIGFQLALCVREVNVVGVGQLDLNDIDILTILADGARGQTLGLAVTACQAH